MSKALKLGLSALVACAVVVVLYGNSASARPPYKAAFDKKYVKDGSPLAAAVAEAKCNVCHEGTKKTDRNAYGMALAKLLTKDDAGNAEKINKALDEVAAQKSADGKTTFGQLIESGKLPGAK